MALRDDKQLRSISSGQSTGTIPPSRARIAQLQGTIAKTKNNIQECQAKLDEACTKLEYQQRTTDEAIQQARSVIEKHIKLLTKYNETKDAAMELLGMIAEKEGKTMREVMEERGVEED